MIVIFCSSHAKQAKRPKKNGPLICDKTSTSMPKWTSWHWMGWC
jgi:hypothetical protein